MKEYAENACEQPHTPFHILAHTPLQTKPPLIHHLTHHFIYPLTSSGDKTDIEVADAATVIPALLATIQSDMFIKGQNQPQPGRTLIPTLISSNQSLDTFADIF